MTLKLTRAMPRGRDKRHSTQQVQPDNRELVMVGPAGQRSEPAAVWASAVQLGEPVPRSRGGSLLGTVEGHRGAAGRPEGWKSQGGKARGREPGAMTGSG